MKINASFICKQERDETVNTGTSQNDWDLIRTVRTTTTSSCKLCGYLDNGENVVIDIKYAGQHR